MLYKGAMVEINGQEGKIGKIVGTPLQQFKGGTRHNEMGFYTIKLKYSKRTYFAASHEIRLLEQSFGQKVTDTLTKEASEK